MKRLLFWVIDCWRLVMDMRYNPLRHVKDPSIQMYIYLALFIMWSGYFGVLAWTYLEWVNYSITQSIFIHLGVLIPLFITNAIFAEAEKNGAKWYKDFRLQQDIEAMDKRLSRSNYEKRVRWDLDREA
jgi:hypothetical protein|tara:strand:- start:97 stop:480 length:384 start_codon:yes stop_codon:yes gene_type:complete